MDRRPTKEEVANAVNKTVDDVIAPNLCILFCGINPGLYTAAVGHHFARPGNRFWRALFSVGFTDHLYLPSEEDKLLQKGIGITNLVGRATLRATDLTKQEYEKGRTELEKKVLQYQPKYLVLLGLDSYKKAFGLKNVVVGEQKERIGDTRVWVLPNPSGLNASFKPVDFEKLFLELKNKSGC